VSRDGLNLGDNFVLGRGPISIFIESKYGALVTARQQLKVMK
jgi:hypothetical protein